MPACKDELKDSNGDLVDFSSVSDIYKSLDTRIVFPANFFNFLDAEGIMEDIREKFLCLYYSHLASTSNDGCPITNGVASCCTGRADSAECTDACPGSMRNSPIFEASDISGTVTGQRLVFEYDHPAVLPSLEDRLDSSNLYGNFAFDLAPVIDLTAEELMVEVFNEYLGELQYLMLHEAFDDSRLPPAFLLYHSIFNASPHVLRLISPYKSSTCT